MCVSNREVAVCPLVGKLYNVSTRNMGWRVFSPIFYLLFKIFIMLISVKTTKNAVTSHSRLSDKDIRFTSQNYFSFKLLPSFIRVFTDLFQVQTNMFSHFLWEKKNPFLTSCSGSSNCCMWQKMSWKMSFSPCFVSAVSYSDGRPLWEERVPAASCLPWERLHRPWQTFFQKSTARDGEDAA